MKIKTEHLVVKDLRFWHAGALYKIFKHPEFFYAYTHQNNANLVISSIKYAFLAEVTRLIVPKQHKLMGIFLENETELVGAAVITDRKNTKDHGIEGEVGYFLDVSHRKHGYALEAISALVQNVKQEEGLDSLVGVTDPENIASQKILEKLGLECTGRNENSPYKKRDGSTAARLEYFGRI